MLRLIPCAILAACLGAAAPPTSPPVAPPWTVDPATFGAVPDDVADDAPAIQSALDAGCSVRLARGRYVLGSTLRLTTDGQSIAGAGRDATTLHAVGDFAECVRADGRADVAIRDLTIDADRAARKAILTTRTLGIFLAGCTDAKVIDCRVTGTIGGPATKGGQVLPGVGIVMGARRGLVAGCLLEGCGEAAEGLTSDGVYASGEWVVIRDCRAEDCTDTAFVVENADHSGVVRCTATRCSAGLAITAARDEPCRGNYADEVTVRDWDAPVTGGVQIGCPAPGTKGDLLDTSLSEVKLVRRGGRGPALDVRRTGKARVVGLSLRGVEVLGAELQGLLVDAEDVDISRCSVSDTDWTAIQLAESARDVAVRRCRIANPRGFGVGVLCPADGVVLQGNRIDGKGGRMSWGVYVFGGGGGNKRAAAIADLGNTVEGALLGAFGAAGKDGE